MRPGQSREWDQAQAEYITGVRTTPSEEHRAALAALEARREAIQARLGELEAAFAANPVDAEVDAWVLDNAARPLRKELAELAEEAEALRAGGSAAERMLTRQAAALRMYAIEAAAE